MDALEFEMPFEVIEPEAMQTPLVFSSPHSGNVFPQAFLAQSRLGIADLRRSADLFVDELLYGAVGRGIPLIKANFPRCFVDANREPYELDPRMFEGRLPAFANTKSVRVASGYGTVARLVAENQEIYRRKLSVEEALRRIDLYYLPYHAALQRQLQELHRRFGYSVLIDWHSMPSAVFPSYRSVDIVLGDRHGTSCAPELTAFVEHAFKGHGFSVQRNLPYAGGYITERYGNPSRGLNALQIEINRSLYMDEEAQIPHHGFGHMVEALMQFTEALLAFEGLAPVRLAAE